MLAEHRGDDAEAAIERAQGTPYSDWHTAWTPIEAEQEYAEPLNA